MLVGNFEQVAIRIVDTKAKRNYSLFIYQGYRSVPAQKILLLYYEIRQQPTFVGCKDVPSNVLQAILNFLFVVLLT